MSDFSITLKTAFEKNKIEYLLDGDASIKFEQLSRIMQAKNADMNITAITDDESIATKHFCDSAFLATLLPDEAELADIGCGGGFPCLPVGILKPNIKITAIDSTAKKVKYVGDTARELGLSEFEAVSMRAEEGAQGEYREKYDVVTARAVASLDVLCELCIPYLKTGGVFYAMKGKGAHDELDTARNAIKMLGGELMRVHEFTLACADGEQTRYIVEIKKTSHTPAQYPRAYAKIKKKPL